MDQLTADWIADAIEATQYGEVTLIVHQGAVVKVLTTARRCRARPLDDEAKCDDSVID